MPLGYDEGRISAKMIANNNLRLSERFYHLLVQVGVVVAQVIDQISWKFWKKIKISSTNFHLRLFPFTLLFEKFIDVSTALHKSNRARDGVESLQGVGWHLNGVELHDSADVRRVDDQEDQSFDDVESRDVHDGTHVGLDALLEEVFAVVVMNAGGGREDRGVPQADDGQRNRLVRFCGSGEVVIAVQPQLVVMVADDVIEDLWKSQKVISTSG